MTLDYCPQCREATSLHDKGACPWCDTQLTRRPWKRGVPSRVTDDQLRALHVAYERGLSLRQLGERVYERLGYSSSKSAAMAIHSGFKRLHLPTRDRIEATVAASTTHGKGSRVNKAEYRRWHRRQTGEVRGVRCEAVRQQYPRKGAPCRNMALAGGRFCYAHDPSRAIERDAILKEARARL